ncbi:MAG TPA: HAD hydrolase-like protein [Candidatus Obscuribacterales bacterium]
MRRRLVLFDIDETMIKSDGAGRRAIMRALRQVFGITCDTTAVAMSGKTDPQICREILKEAGFSCRDLESRLKEVFQVYPPMLAEEIERSAGYRLHQGVRELIEALLSTDSAYLGLVTGNIEPGARLKLAPFDLNCCFPIGAFGCDSADRMDLPPIARKRASAHYKVDFSHDEVVVIGDSVADVRCAAGYGALSIAVASGKTPRTDLAACRPHFLFESLQDTQAVLEAIFSTRAV